MATISSAGLALVRVSTRLWSLPDAQIYQLGEAGVQQIDYRETEHYLVTKGFLNNPEKMLATLFD